VPKTCDYVRVSLVRLVGSERELDLKGFQKYTGHNYSDDIYKVETIDYQAKESVPQRVCDQ